MRAIILALIAFGVAEAPCGAADLRIPKPRKPPQVTVVGPLALPGPVEIGKHVIRKNEDTEPAGRHVGMP
jgi:hypothetical protein